MDKQGVGGDGIQVLEGHALKVCQSFEGRAIPVGKVEPGGVKKVMVTVGD